MARGNWKTGARAGYADWRYGDAHARPVAKPTYLSAAKRSKLITLTAKIMGGWTFSPFQHEASCRHGLRSALCLDGAPWGTAEAEAKAIVSGALALLEVRRPTWEQGQREYVIAAEDCNWCGRPLDPDHIRARFCSPECGRSALEHRNYERTAKDDLVRQAAYAMVRKGRNKPRNCLECGDEFQPFKATSDQKFCSRACSCTYRESNAIFPRVCESCDKSYLARQNRGHYCGAVCRAMGLQIRRGNRVSISPQRFDQILTMPINASRPAWLTPERFDEMVAA